MHAVASARFMYTAPSGLVHAKPGDLVVGFDGWPENNRRAMLASKMVQFVSDVAEDAVEVPLTNLGGLSCEDCGKTFKGAGGLSIHRAKAHRALDA